MSTANLFSDPEISSSAIKLLKAHPLVIFSMTENYERRPAGCDVAAGLLLGSVHAGTAVVTDTITLKLGENNAVDERLRTKMLGSFMSRHPAEQVIGFYVFGDNKVEVEDCIPADGCGVHMWFKPTTPISTSAFCIMKTEDQSYVYHPIQFEMNADIDEQIAISQLAISESSDSLHTVKKELVSLVKAVKDYCDSESADSLILRQIYDAIQETKLGGDSLTALETSVNNIKELIKTIQNVDQQALLAEKNQNITF